MDIVSTVFSYLPYVFSVLYVLDVGARTYTKLTASKTDDAFVASVEAALGKLGVDVTKAP